MSIFEDTMSFVRIGVLVLMPLCFAFGCNNEVEQPESSSSLNFIRLNSKEELESFFTIEANLVLYNKEGDNIQAHVFDKYGVGYFGYQFPNYVLNISLIKECINGDLLAIAGLLDVNAEGFQNGLLRFNSNGLVDTLHLKPGVVKDVIEYVEKQYIVASVTYGAIGVENKAFLEKYTKGERAFQVKIPAVRNSSSVNPIALIKSAENHIKLFGYSHVGDPRISLYTFNNNLELQLVNHKVLSYRWGLNGAFNRSEAREKDGYFYIYQKLTNTFNQEKVIRRIRLNNEGNEVDELWYSHVVDHVIFSGAENELVGGDNFTPIDSITKNNVFYALADNQGNFDKKEVLGTDDLIHTIIDGSYLENEFKILLRSRSQETLKDRYTIMTVSKDGKVVF